MNRVLAVDFDETITTRDTVARLPKLAAQCRSSTEAQGRRRSWEEGVSSYIAEWRDTFEAVLASPPQGPSAADRVDAFSRLFADIENGSLTAIEGRDLLRGIPRAALSKCGESIQKRDGAHETLTEARERGFDVHIVSANWSADMLRGALVWVENVHSNDLEFDADGVTTGRFLRRVVSARDKRTCLREISRGRPVTYIGDGMNDLAALVEADLGIVIGDKPDMIRVCDALSIPTYPLDQMVRVSAGESLLRVSCWAEIADVLFERERVGVEPTADV
ncbi:MAG: haloacid dehalogenase-like hydrolase [Candidatus Poribacteria bacterium]